MRLAALAEEGNSVLQLSALSGCLGVGGAIATVVGIGGAIAAVVGVGGAVGTVMGVGVAIATDVGFGGPPAVATPSSAFQGPLRKVAESPCTTS